jgi:hypothetical protein
MTISIDGQENKQLQLTGKTLGDVLGEVRRLLAESGRMIVGIVCDGEIVAPEMLDQKLTESAEGCCEIDFQTATPDELVRSSLATCKDFILAIRKDLGEVVNNLRQSRVKESMDKIGPIFTLLNQTHRGVFGVFKLLNLDPAGVEFEWGTAGQLLTGMVDQLQQIKQALVNNDYVQLADLLEYELGTTLERWEELIDTLTLRTQPEEN